MELARFELATSWVRSTRKPFPRFVMCRHSAWLRGIRAIAFAVLCRSSSPECVRDLTTARGGRWGDGSVSSRGFRAGSTSRWGRGGRAPGMWRGGRCDLPRKWDPQSRRVVILLDGAGSRRVGFAVHRGSSSPGFDQAGCGRTRARPQASFGDHGSECD